ncbi:MAG: hypothetical protein VXW65_05965 [Pseudomonadota bacterium]|nr:hypothetical protein [Pseudomonadota bacterium]
MTQAQPQWKRRALVVALSVLSSHALALQPISDEEMSAATGEGIAFLPEDVSLRFNGADNNNGGQGTFDTGYIRYIPVGPLTTEAAASGAGKGDIFLYGLAISQSNQDYGDARTSADWNTRFGRTIDSWGTAENPWLLRVATDPDVPNFDVNDPNPDSVSFLSVEAPLARSNVAALSSVEQSAYNLKLGLWADAFVRDPSVAENMTATGSQFDLGGSGRENRIRLQAVWDGLSINGTQLQIFQTLGGATNAGGMSTSYNNTLGIAGVLRFNSGDGQNLRAIVSAGSATRNTPAWTDHSATFGCGNNSTSFNTAACQFRFRSRTVTDSVSDLNWAVPALASVLRLSTRETANTGLLATPAINGGGAPAFDPNEGLYIYNLNTNLVLGSLYQPLTVGVADDGQNISLEIARIPNKESIYKRIYTDYSGSDATYLGSTCNFYQCGATRTLGGVDYQGNTATHSSISIGSTEYDAITNSLTAYSGVEAIGVSFGQLQSRFQAGPFISERFQLEFQQRQRRDSTGVFTDRYRLRDDGGGTQEDPFGHPAGDCDGGGLFGLGSANCGRYINRQGFHTDWIYLTSNTGGVKVFGDAGGAYTTAELYGTPMPGGIGATGNTNNPGSPFMQGLHDCVGGITNNNCNGASGGNGDGVYGVGVIRIDAQVGNRSWALNATRNNTWFVAGSNPNTQENVVFREILPAFANTPTDVIPATPTVAINPSALNNYGSAVIDGLLIQHLKFTTRGL